MNHNKIIQFIKDLYGQDQIPLHVPTFSGNEKKYLNECIDSTFVSSVGQFVNDFETALADYTKVNHAVLCVNGTNAIHICLLLAGVQPNDEVLTQPLTFVATVNAITYANAKPVFIDVDKDTMGLSPTALQHFLDEHAEVREDGCYNKTTGNKISACLPMHTFGHACRIEEIKTICDNYSITLVEDAAEAMGSTYNGKHLGSYGELSAISFNGNKIITTGGGGVILTNDENKAKQAKHLTTQAKIPHQWEYKHDAIGYNYRMPNLNAALGLAQLEQIDDFLLAKREIAQQYKSFFTDQSILFFNERENERCNFWLNAIVLTSKEERDAFLQATNQQNIYTRPIWALASELNQFKHCTKGELTNSYWLQDRVVNLPSSVIA